MAPKKKTIVKKKKSKPLVKTHQVTITEEGLKPMSLYGVNIHASRVSTKPRKKSIWESFKALWKCLI